MLSSLRYFTVFILLVYPAHGDADLVTLYFGCGCFWHVQHEFIKAEEQILGRSSSTYTSLSGYAGGKALNSKGNTCYYDYGGLGHTEVVGLTIPKDKAAEFGAVFWKLFVGKDRIDVMDRGPEYRAALGLPGGISSDLFAVINAAQDGNVQQPFELRAGAGDDPDTLGQALVWVYDSNEYPFYQAEMYHQFHDDFMAGGNYPDAYNALGSSLLQDCRMLPTGCRNDRSAPPANCASSTPTNAPAGSTSSANEESTDSDVDHDGGSGGGFGGSGSLTTATEAPGSEKGASSQEEKGGSGSGPLDVWETTSRPNDPASAASSQLKLRWLTPLILMFARIVL